MFWDVLHRWSCKSDSWFLFAVVLTLLCILLGSPTASGDDAQCWGCDEGDVEGDGKLLYLVSFLLLTYLLIFSVWFVRLCLRIVRCLWDIERKVAPHDTKGIIKWFGDASHSASSSWCLIKLHLVLLLWAQDWLSGIQMMMTICRLGTQLAWTGDEDESHVLSDHFCIGPLDLHSQHLFLFEWNWKWGFQNLS